MKYYLFAYMIVGSLVSCGPKELPSQGDQAIEVFSNDHLYFDPQLNDEKLSADWNDLLRLSSGRILLKKVTIPAYIRHTKVEVEIIVTSAGDRWDKSGSCFVIPEESVINFLEIQREEQEWPKVLNANDSFPGIVSGKGYKPVIELMRFMTPFGVGYYSDSMEFRRPVYIPKWEKEVRWKQDITDRISRLQGEVIIGVWIDTWTKEGYKVSVSLTFDEVETPYWRAKQAHVEPLINTIAYAGGQRLCDLFADNNLETSFNIPRNAVNVKLYYVTTGHGGHSGGDEFVKKENVISVDGNEIYRFIPWRDDCASFRRFNPHSGVWMVKDTIEYIDRKVRGYRKKEIEERIASSDHSRSNWCPGSDVMPEIISLDQIKEGVHELVISIPGAQVLKENEYNHWLVSAWLQWEE